MLSRLTSRSAGSYFRSAAARFTPAQVDVAKQVAVGGAASGAVAWGAYFFYNKMMFATAAAQGPAFDPNAFRPYKLQQIQTVNHNSKIFRFALDSATQELNMPVASCIVTKGPLGDDGKPLIRPYTPLAGDEKGHFDLLVKVYPEGKMSKHIWSLKPGDTLEVKGPIAKLPYKPNMKKRIGMVAGGTGITPMLQVIHEILKNPQDKTEVTLVFANIAEEDILLKAKLDDYAKKYKNFKVHYVLEKPPSKWSGSVGYVSEDVIKKHIPAPGPDSLVLVCGPPPMMNAISGPKAKDYTQGEVGGLLQKLNYQKDHIFKF